MVAASAVQERTLLNWAGLIPAPQWMWYRQALQSLQQRGVRFALGGGLAFSAYSHRWRNTKDMDIYVLPEDHPAAIEALSAAGFEDYFPRSPYDRSWSYRSYRDGVILDVLWKMANHLTPTVEAWVSGGPEIDVHGLRMRLLPVEELLWVKLYVFQRERCDWPDLLNLLAAQGETLDWHHLLDSLGEDAPLMGAVLGLFGWMCPAQARRLPEWIWSRVGVSRPQAGPDCLNDRRRVGLLNSHDWFGPNAP